MKTIVDKITVLTLVIKEEGLLLDKNQQNLGKKKYTYRFSSSQCVTGLLSTGEEGRENTFSFVIL